jgi:hypothetical protein
VTTHAPNSRSLLAFGRGLGPLAARPLCGGVLSLHFDGLASLGLSATGLPAAKKAAALRVEAIALVPTLRLIPLAAPSTMADSWSRLTPAGLGACFRSRLTGAHGSLRLPRVSPGKRFNLPRALSFNRRKPAFFSLPRLVNETKKKTALEIRA